VRAIVVVVVVLTAELQVTPRPEGSWIPKPRRSGFGSARAAPSSRRRAQRAVHALESGCRYPDVPSGPEAARVMGSGGGFRWRVQGLGWRCEGWFHLGADAL